MLRPVVFVRIEDIDKNFADERLSEMQRQLAERDSRIAELERIITEADINWSAICSEQKRDIERLTDALKRCRSYIKNVANHPQAREYIDSALSTPSAQQAQERIAAQENFLAMIDVVIESLTENGFDKAVKTLAAALQRWRDATKPKALGERPSEPQASAEGGSA